MLALASYALAGSSYYSGGGYCHDPDVPYAQTSLAALCSTGTESTERTESHACVQDGVTYYVLTVYYTYWTDDGDFRRYFYDARTLELTSRQICSDYYYYGCTCIWDGLLLDDCLASGVVPCPTEPDPHTDQPPDPPLEHSSAVEAHSSASPDPKPRPCGCRTPDPTPAAWLPLLAIGWTRRRAASADRPNPARRG